MCRLMEGYVLLLVENLRQDPSSICALVLDLSDQGIVLNAPS